MHAQLSGSFTTPATRLQFLLRSPRMFEQRSHSSIRIIELRVDSPLDEQPFQLAYILVRNQRLLTSQTQEIKTTRTDAPRRRVPESIKIDHRFVSGKLTRIDNLLLRLTAQALFDFQRRFNQPR